MRECTVGILDQLSSSLGERKEQANLAAAKRCLADPGLLNDIAAGLASGDAARMGDCAEVFTHVAETRPDLVSPFAGLIVARMEHAATRVRWESMHALANIAGESPNTIAPLRNRLRKIIQSDTSVIVRDNAVRAVGNFASTSREAARAAFPILVEALTVWDEKHAALALHGLANLATRLPERARRLQEIADHYEQNPRGVIRKAARTLRNALRHPINSD
jgi:hypothetical protein